MIKPAASLSDTQAAVPAAAQRWALIGLICAVLLNLQHVALWCLPVAAGGAAWRAWAHQQPSRLMGRLTLICVAAILTLAVLLSFRTLNGLDAGTSLLVAMITLKLMESQRLRDWLIVLGGALFLLLAACLASQALWRVPLYAAELWLLCSCLYALGAGPTLPAPLQLLRASGKSLAVALPLALLLFLLFPRLSGALWSIPREDDAITGLGEDMSPGSISHLIESEEPALRVRFDGSLPPREERYWRGPVLHQFDGYTWRRIHDDLGAAPALQFAGTAYRYEITLEPNAHGVLIALELPRGLPQPRLAGFETFDYQLISSAVSDSAVDYRLESYPHHRSLEPLPAAMRALDLALPRGRNPRSLELAQRLRASAADDRGYVEAVLDYLRRGGFAYTLTPSRLNRNSVDDLLFNTHEGFCGHYASAFAFLMRAGGVPAHVVTGYLGGQWNRFGSYLLVRQSNAHAWTEVWLDGAGWVRVDPTGVIDPNRIDNDANELLSGAGVGGGRARLFPWLAATLQAWQAMDAWWKDEFVSFNSNKQLNLLGELGFKDRELEALIGGLALGGALWLSCLTWRGRQRGIAQPRDALGRIWSRLERALRRHDAVRALHEGPVRFGARIAAERPELAAALAPLTRQYAQLRYGRQCSEAELERFRRAVRLFTARLAR